MVGPKNTQTRVVRIGIDRMHSYYNEKLTTSPVAE